MIENSFTETLSMTENKTRDNTWLCEVIYFVELSNLNKDVDINETFLTVFPKSISIMLSIMCLFAVYYYILPDLSHLVYRPVWYCDACSTSQRSCTKNGTIFLTGK